MENKPNILFFARVQFAHFYPRLKSDKYNSYYVCLNKQEKSLIEKSGNVVEFCFEEEYEALEVAEIPKGFLQSSFYADRFLGWLDIHDRMEILGKEITFWRSVFNKRKYSACIHETITLEIEEVLSLIAKEYDCRDMTAIFSFLDGYFYWKHSPYNSLFDDNSIKGAEARVEDTAMIKQYVSKVKEIGHRPYYSKLKYCNFRSFHLFIKSAIKSLINRFVSYELIKKDILFFYNSRYNIFNYRHYIVDCFFVRYFHSSYYDDITDYKEYKKLLFPMHVEPEATLLYFSPEFSEQITIIQEIAKVLPENYVLCVKEHPAQYGQLRQKEFKKLRERNSNIIYISDDTSSNQSNSHSLLKSVEAVVTITGNTGLEALINNVPAIVFGDVFYSAHKSIHRIKRFSELRDILVNDRLNIPNDEDTIEFLAKIKTFLHEGYPIDIKRHNDANNIKLIVNSIEKELKLI